MPFYRRDAVSPSAVRVHPGAVIPRSEARDPRERIGAALAGISAEVAELPWDWRERTAEERAQDERRPWYWPSTVLTVERARAMGPQRLVNVRTGEVMRVVTGARMTPEWEWLNDTLVPRART